MLIVEASQIPPVDKIEPVPLDDPMKVYKVCQELQTLCMKEHGIGISAVQVGIPWKLFLVLGDGSCPFIPKGEFGYFVNCDYKATTDEQVVSLEGCLSLRSPDGRLRSFQVNRHKIISLFGFRLTCDKALKFEPLDASVSVFEEGIVFQHEIDHHRGILISDIGKEVFVW